ncbi:MAG TPA: TolC family protein [Polyangia bacterium]|nr:TolC family protein [Polyangia bacterium]
MPSSHARPLCAALTLLCAASSVAWAGAPSAPGSAGEAALPIPSARAVTLPEALAYARAHQPAVRAALARIAEERANAAVPRAAWYPFLGATAQVLEGTANNTTASTFGTEVVDLPRIGGTRSNPTAADGRWRPYASTLAAIGGSQEVFDFGRIAAASAAADAQVTVAQRAADAVALDVALGVEEAYFAVNAAKSILRSAQQAYERAQVHRDFAQAGVRSGLRSPIELTRAEADLTRFDTARIRALGGVTAAEAVLAAAVGAPDPALDAANVPTTPRELPALADALRAAEAKEPQLQAAIASLRAQEQQTRAIGASMRPDLQLSATISGRAGGAPPNGADARTINGFVPEVPNWDVGLVLAWPLYDPVIAARRDASRAVEQVRREQIDLQREQLVATVERAYVSVDVARRALPSLQREVEAAQANYAQADARFKAGMGTSVELADAEALRTDAEIRLTMGVFDLAKARAGFGRALAENL